MLELLEGRASIVAELGNRFTTVLECVGHYSTSSAGLFLTADVVRRLARLNLAVDYDLYYPEPG